MNIRQIIEQAKKVMDEDPHLANYILRDTAEIKEAGLSDLAWACHKEYCVKNDVLFLIERLEKFLERREK